MEVARFNRFNETRLRLVGAVFIDEQGNVVGYAIDPTRPKPTYLLPPQSVDDLNDQLTNATDSQSTQSSGEKKR